LSDQISNDCTSLFMVLTGRAGDSAQPAAGGGAAAAAGAQGGGSPAEGAADQGGLD